MRMGESSGGGRLTRRQRWTLVLLGGALGAVIGPVGFWLRGLAATQRLRERTGSTRAGRPLEWSSALDAIGTGRVQIAFMVLAFFATLALMPLLLRWLEERVDHPAARFHALAAVAGVAFGTAATVLTAMGIFVTLLIVGMVHPGYGANASSTGASVGGLAFGVALFAPLVGAVVPFLFVKWIVMFGVPFGLLFGLLVRRLSQPG